MQRTLLVATALLVACSREIPVEKQSAIPAAPSQPARLVSYYEGTNAADAVAQVRAKVGEPFRVLNVSIYRDRVTLQAQDPKKKENVDEYVVESGVLKPPKPVHLIGIGADDAKTLEANLFDPATVDLAKIPDLIHEADQKVQIEGRTFGGVDIRRDMFESDGPVRIDMDYSGTRKNGYLRTDRHGAHGTVHIH